MDILGWIRQSRSRLQIGLEEIAVLVRHPPWEVELRPKKSEQYEVICRELLASSEEIFSNNEQTELASALRDFFPPLDRAFVLKWIPEQSEDIYWVLISATTILEVEIPRGRRGPNSLQAIDVAMFRGRPHARKVMEKLEVALKLVQA